MKYRGRTIVHKVLGNGDLRWQVGLWQYREDGTAHKRTRRFTTLEDAKRFIDDNPSRIRRYTNITDEQYIEAIKQSRSIAGALRLLGVVPEGGNYRVLHRVVQRLDLDISHFKGQHWASGSEFPARRRPIEDYLSNKYPIDSHRLKTRLIREGIFERRCHGCNLDEWMHQPIPIELDHIDGNHQNNTLVNLRLLCGNCHGLTPTYRGKNKGWASQLLDSAA